METVIVSVSPGGALQVNNNNDFTSSLSMILPLTHTLTLITGNKSNEVNSCLVLGVCKDTVFITFSENMHKSDTEKCVNRYYNNVRNVTANSNLHIR